MKFGTNWPTELDLTTKEIDSVTLTMDPSQAVISKTIETQATMTKLDGDIMYLISWKRKLLP